jgi:ABC-type Fe3+-citrate transport system substrate-binding protein
MPRKRKTIKELLEEEKRLREQLAKKKQKLNALRKKVREEYRKREARFLIAIGRTLLKYGKHSKASNDGRVYIGIPLEALTEIFKDYRDIAENDKDFNKWLEVLRGLGIIDD